MELGSHFWASTDTDVLEKDISEDQIMHYK